MLVWVTEADLASSFPGRADGDGQTGVWRNPSALPPTQFRAPGTTLVKKCTSTSHTVQSVYPPLQGFPGVGVCVGGVAAGGVGLRQRSQG